MQRRLAPPTILIVEDDGAVLGALQFSLEGEGFKVVGRADAEALLQAPPEADCLVVDYFLPGLNGLDLIERLRALEIPTPAILITSAPTRAVAKRAETMGVPIIEKPLLTDSLVDAVRAALHERPDASEWER